MTELPANQPTLSLRGITKTFPGVLANDQIDLDIYPGEIHALLGENGAGKSTLMKILYGFYRMEKGEILWKGEPIQISTPSDARRYGIGMVFQDFSLIPAFTVADNIALFLPDLPVVYRSRQVRQRIEQVSRRYGLVVNPGAWVAHLSIGEQQKVELMKLLLSDARVLILDEPTRVLAPHEIQALFGVLSNLRQDGYSIILITHKLQEVLDIADRVTVLRAGRVGGTLPGEEACEETLVQLMFEKQLELLDRAPADNPFGGQPPLLELQGIETRAEGSQVGLKSIDLEVFPGEIVGIAGVSGNGQKEFSDLVIGLVRASQGVKKLFGQDATRWSTRQVRSSGVAFIPESPLQMAAAPWMTVLQNSILTRTGRYAANGGLRLDWKRARADIETSFARLRFPQPALYTPAKSLSGGNLQRFVIARELAFKPRLIVASYLTSGLDVQSAVAARQALIDAKRTGAGVLMISDDLDELFSLSDRLAVLFGGQITRVFVPRETNVFEIGHLMTGSSDRVRAKPVRPAA